MQAVTSTSPLCHMQVHCHHPVMACKTYHDTALMPSQHGVQAWLWCQPAPQKPHHSATPMWHTSPAMAPTCHTWALPQCASPTTTLLCPSRGTAHNVCRQEALLSQLWLSRQGSGCVECWCSSTLKGSKVTIQDQGQLMWIRETRGAHKDLETRQWYLLVDK